jgi:putative endonuclease
MPGEYYVYIMANKSNKVLYTGVTSNLRKRVYEHRENVVEGFTERYNVVKLVYYEACDDVRSAIAREKQTKAGSRRKKIDLSNSVNGEWRDLYDELADCHAPIASGLAMTERKGRKGICDLFGNS